MSKPFSISLASKSKKPSSPGTPLNQTTTVGAPPRKPPSNRAARPFGDHDSEGEDDRPPAAEEVTGFDQQAGGAIGAHKYVGEGKKPLVIKVESKNNWQDRGRRRRKDLLLPEVRAQREQEEQGKAGAGNVEVEGPSMQYGLSFAQKTETKAEEDGEGRNVEIRQEISSDTPMPDADEPQKPVTQDDTALQALLRESKGEEGGRRTDLVIESRRKSEEEDEYESHYDETRNFRADVASRPESASLSDYNNIPVEEFGAALLRGMGWKEGEPVGRGKYSSTTAKARVPERRPGYLGIGAKEVGGKAGSSELELGAWGKSAMRRAKPGEGLYTPVLMKNKATGEMISEKEFKKLEKENSKKNDDDWKERRDRNLQRNGRDRDRDQDRHRRRDDDEDDKSDGYRRTDSSSRRDGSLSPDDRDRERRRRRYRDDEGDRDSERDDRYYRDRERRHRRDREDSDRSRRYKEDSGSREDSRHSSHSSRRDRDSDRDSRRDRDRYKDRGDRYEDDRRSKRREEVY